jgi:hypothetical protein
MNWAFTSVDAPRVTVAGPATTHLSMIRSTLFAARSTPVTDSIQSVIARIDRFSHVTDRSPGRSSGRRGRRDRAGARGR